MKQPEVLIIGAGVAGITAAAHLAQHGLRVTVLDKNDHAGGRCDQFVREGHRFDSGPTLLVMPLIYETEFATLGASIWERLELQRVDPTYHLVFDDGSQLALTSDLTNLRKQIEGFETGSFAELLRYLEEGRRHYDIAVDKLVYRDFRKATDLLNIGNIPLLFQVKPFAKHYGNMRAYFDEPRLKAAFTFQDVYLGLSPFEAPATFSLMPYTELAHGVWYPKGGMYSVVNALMDIARQAGVEFFFDAEVDQILVRGDQVTSVRLMGGEIMEADAILANADLPYVYSQLLPDDPQTERLAHKEYSCSVVSFFWGVNKVYPQLPPHTLFLADDYRQNFHSISHDLTLPANPSLYVHAPARLDTSMAPPGEDTLTAIVPVGHLTENGEQDWNDLRDRAREHVFRRLALLGISDLGEHIKFETNFTPLSWRKRYNLAKGSTHGLSHNLLQLAYFRPSNRHARYHNLYFAGASTRPGTGLPTAMISGRLTAKRLLDDFVTD
ncbi:MAG: phytoene desaturase family protein [Chloroflexi bacterium]|nr:phytoene desaturase family protein [Chloroflexota bacterium]